MFERSPEVESKGGKRTGKLDVGSEEGHGIEIREGIGAVGTGLGGVREAGSGENEW